MKKSSLELFMVSRILMHDHDLLTPVFISVYVAVGVIYPEPPPPPLNPPVVPVGCSPTYT